jgi:hypothetical protein
MTKNKKPTTVEGWEKVCNNLDSALQLSIQQEDELIAEIEVLRMKNEDLNTSLIRAAGIINYLEMKLERPNSV